ncbi:MAG: hypothetical protein JWO76_2805 [Nocardioides sp.]|nr:hypothetical protein [Nocardioides sp.]
MTDDTDFDRDDELRARLRSVDPASSLPPADPTRVARLLEDTMSNTVDHEGETELTRETGTHGRNPLTWLVAAAAVLIIAGVGAFGLLNHGLGADEVPRASDPGQTVTHLGAPGAASGRCMVPNADLLSTQTLAFEGTVQGISDGVVTLVPTRFFAGDETDVVEIKAPSADLQALIGAADFEEGGTYLVSATGGRVTVCGFSGPATPQLTALYEQAFPA